MEASIKTPWFSNNSNHSAGTQGGPPVLLMANAKGPLMIQSASQAQPAHGCRWLWAQQHAHTPKQAYLPAAQQPGCHIRLWHSKTTQTTDTLGSK
jgi:hypothetical protein